MELNGRVALVTGASRGLGQHIARALSRAGARVAVTARSEQELRALVTELGGTASAHVGDVTVDADRRRLLAEVESTAGPVDVLVNNAGANRPCAYVQFPAEELNFMVALNLVAPMLLTQLVLPGMLQRGRGQIVNISSMSGIKGTPFAVTYSATKFGLNGFSDALRHELLGTGVSVSAICPGYVEGEGAFARHSGEVQGGLGMVAPGAVAAAVVDAVRRDRARVLVAPRVMRFGGVLALASPETGIRLSERRGLREFNRRRAEAESERRLK
ncbi:MAG: SDR family NAD(P)-dependent oxidoreductase [Candidatus Dormibacteria bacterium]